MEGYEIYRLSDEEIQHVGVKGMKWGKRKSRSAYMTAVDKHEAKTKSVAAAKSTSAPWQMTMAEHAHGPHAKAALSHQSYSCLHQLANAPADPPCADQAFRASRASAYPGGH